MTTCIPLFDINVLDIGQQQKFHTVYNELKSHHASYLQDKLNLQLKNKLAIDEEENEWRYQLHRYLRARKWNINHTVKSIREMIQWRIDNRVDLILEHQPTILRMDLLRRMLPNAIHGSTKAHRPLYIEKTGRMHVDEVLNQFTSEELIQCHVYWLEFMCQLARERSRQLGKHIETFAIIYDLHGCKLEIRKTFHILKQILYIEDNYYPERLGQMFVMNPPRIFPVLWDLAKH
ncbi:unnamed protein product, partial [Rotaria sp. Silwood2]